MGRAMLDGWLDRGLAAEDIVVVEPLGLPSPPQPDLTLVSECRQVSPEFRPDVVILAVKPQVMAEVLPPYVTHRSAVFLSIAAGKPIAFFQKILGADAAIVRAMPNTPAAVRRGITVAVATGAVNQGQRQVCAELLAAVGEIAWVEDEALMDAVTAVSGSGPAYVFLLAEVLAAAGVAAGLPEALALRLARATVSGAGALLDQSTASPTVLRQDVTSPGGTTFAALQVLMGEDGLLPLMTRAVAAASARSTALSEG